jgi:hypothetical protein
MSQEKFVGVMLYAGQGKTFWGFVFRQSVEGFAVNLVSMSGRFDLM